MLKHCIVLLSLVNILCAVEAVDILKRIDANKLVADDTAFEMDITAMKGDSLVDQYKVKGYVSVNEGRGKSILYFTAPVSVKGRKMLMIGNDTWMHFPNTRNVMRLSPMQILLGETANGDVARATFGADYNATTVVEETYKSNAVYRIRLKVKEQSKGSTYGEIVLLVKKKSYAPLYVEFISDGGKLLKIAYYKDFQMIEDKEIPMTLEIHDGANQNNYTIMHYNKMTAKKIPALYFTKEYLPRFQPVESDAK